MRFLIRFWMVLMGKKLRWGLLGIGIGIGIGIGWGWGTLDMTVNRGGRWHAH